MIVFSPSIYQSCMWVCSRGCASPFFCRWCMCITVHEPLFSLGPNFFLEHLQKLHTSNLLRYPLSAIVASWQTHRLLWKARRSLNFCHNSAAADAVENCSCSKSHSLCKLQTVISHLNYRPHPDFLGSGSYSAQYKTNQAPFSVLQLTKSEQNGGCQSSLLHIGCICMAQTIHASSQLLLCKSRKH